MNNAVLSLQDMHSQANGRRQALVDFLKSRNLTRGGLARATGISPNIIYNFLSGKSSYLSQPTLEKIAVYYAVPIAELTGDSRPADIGMHDNVLREREPDSIGAQTASPPTGTILLKVVGTVMGAGIWTESLFPSTGSSGEVLLPIPRLYAETAFAVRLSDSVASSALPAGALLGCVAMRDYQQRPVSGDLVLAARRNSLGLFECDVCEYQVQAPWPLPRCTILKDRTGGTGAVARAAVRPRRTRVSGCLHALGRAFLCRKLARIAAVTNSFIVYEFFRLPSRSERVYVQVIASPGVARRRKKSKETQRPRCR